MDTSKEKTGTGNNNPQTKGTNMKATKAYRNVKTIKSMIKGDDPWKIQPEDKALLDTIASTPLADMISTEKGIDALQRMGQVIRLTKRGEKDGKSVQLQKDFDMWSNEEWALVLTNVDMIVTLQYPNQKKKQYIDFKDFDVEKHGDFVVVDTSGLPKGHKGLVQAKIGGLNFKTGTVDHIEEPVIIPYGEAFHMWHDLKAKRPSKKRTSGNGTATGMSMLESAQKDLKAAKDAKNTVDVNRLTKTVEFLQKKQAEAAK